MDKCDAAFESKRYVITAFEGLGGQLISLKDFWREAWEACERELQQQTIDGRSSKLEEIDSLELFYATELEVVVCRLPTSEEVVIFRDCTGNPPVIYKWCLDEANEWLSKREKPVS